MEHRKCSIKPQKAGKEQKTKIGTKNKGNILKTVMNIIDINPTKSINTLNVNGLNASRDCQSGSKNKIQLYVF